MDPGVVGFDGLVGSDTCSGFGVSLASDPETNKPNKWYGSGLFLKQERSNASSEEELRSSKLAKTERNPLLRSNATLFSDGHHQQQMLSFSSPKSDSFLVDKATQNATLPYSYHPFSTYSRNPGGSMHGALASVRGAFTPSQWMELEHQALIYKYITANVPVPTHLLIPIKKALDSAGFYNLSNGLLRPNALGWGGIHLGLSSNCTDPEPGRCRRTDGKKWRCSRDAVVDQKYCERHMNRGRHRSRKPVEQPHSSTTATVATTTPNNIQLLPSNTNNRVFVSNKENNNGSERLQDGSALPMLPPTLELKSAENNNTNPFLMQKNQISYDESSSRNNEFGLVTSDSLLNPSHKTTSTMLRNFSSSEKDSSETQQHHSLRHFIDESPKTQSHHHHPNHRVGGMWPEPDMQPDRTQLSISIPISSSNLMSFTSSPSNEKLTLSPLRLSKELDPIQMGLGVGSGVNESTTRQANWIPITWESSMGGPLGEVLQVTSNCFNNHTKASGGDHHLRHNQCGNNNTSALNLMKDRWDNSPPLGSSPTGVLQKTAFGSLSNSSAGSSPRADNNKEGTTLCNELLPAPL